MDDKDKSIWIYVQTCFLLDDDGEFPPVAFAASWNISFQEKTIIEEDIKKNRKKSTKSTIILYRKYTKKKKPKTLIKYEKVKIHFSITVPIYHNQNEQNLMNKYFWSILFYTYHLLNDR